MSDKTKELRHISRTEIKDLPSEEKVLSAAEQKKIQGGANRIVGGGIRGNGNAVSLGSENSEEAQEGHT